jgi:hypothetical protein
VGLNWAYAVEDLLEIVEVVLRLSSTYDSASGRQI